MPDWKPEIRERLANLKLEPAREAAIVEELAQYLDDCYAELRSSGSTESEACQQALAELSGGELLAHELRRVERQVPQEPIALGINRRTNMIADLWQDLRFGARMLRKQPGFTLIAVLTLAFGIGANTAIFSVADALLFRPPVGVAKPGELVDIGRSRGGDGFSPNSYLNYVDLRQRATTLDGVYAYPLFPQALSLGNAAGAERILGAFVSTNYFTVLGASPVTGRLFSAADSERPGASPQAVLSHACWTRRFNGDPAIVGQSITINRQPFTIIGVASAGFQGTGVRAIDIWLPLGMVASVTPQGAGDLTNRAAAWLLVGGRLKPGVARSQAAAEVETIGLTLAHEYPEQNRDRGLRLQALSPLPSESKAVAAFLALLIGLVVVVLLIACANLAGVLLSRAVARRREIAVRLAMGAGRGRLVRQLLAETMLLFALGEMVGLSLAPGLTSLLSRLLPALPFSIQAPVALNSRALILTTCVVLLAALLSGLAPALQGSKAEVLSALKDEAPALGRLRLRSAFIVAEVAFSILLVVVAGLFVRALQRIGATNPGFDPHGVELMSLDLSVAGYDEATAPAFARTLIERVRQAPDVQDATIAAVLPGGFSGIGLGGIGVPGSSSPNGRRSFSADWNIVEPGYFATLRMPLLAGRDFNDADRQGTPPVVILGEGAARRFWPGESAVGKYVSHQRGAVERLLQVVGVVGDPKYGSLVDGATGLYVYLPLQQEYLPGWTMIVARSKHDRRITDELRALVASVDPNLPVGTTQTAEEYTALGLLPQRIALGVSGTLGIVGLLLAAIGIYGVTAYAVTRRTREIGIRLALGAPEASVFRLVLRQGMALVAVGCVIGLLLAAGASSLLASLLFGLTPFDPVTFIGAAALFGFTGLVACYAPARRATKVDPMTALRSE
jgi:predicted permease